MKKIVLFMVLSLLVFTITPTFASTGLDFYKAGVEQQMDVIDKHIVVFMERGYVNVPNWIDLHIETERIIRVNSNENLSNIIFTAAKNLGMYK